MIAAISESVNLFFIKRFARAISYPLPLGSLRSGLFLARYVFCNFLFFFNNSSNLGGIGTSLISISTFPRSSIFTINFLNSGPYFKFGSNFIILTGNPPFGHSGLRFLVPGTLKRWLTSCPATSPPIAMARPFRIPLTSKSIFLFLIGICFFNNQ
ncbi:hypothetical protein ES705_35475 [subsurface metagenome]